MLSRRAKRILDLSVASAALIVLAPLILLTGTAIALTMGSPILFRQMRLGLDCRPFALLKFRTMSWDRDGFGNLLPDEIRLTRLGRLMRRLSLDELPQLWNVLKGEMSLVGPRPLLTKYRDRYSTTQLRRHEVMPGITGWAQINGRNDLSWENKFALDVWYVDNWSFGLDLRVLAKTFWKVITRNGISRHGHATAPEFAGNGSCDESQRVLRVE